MDKNIQCKINHHDIKLHLSTLLFCFILLSPVVVHASYYQTMAIHAQMDNTKITLDLKNKTLAEIVTALCKQAKLKYGFHSSVKVDANQQFSLTVTNVSVKDALQKLLANTAYDYKTEEDRIIIINRVAKSVQKSKVLSGKIIDATTNKPLVGAAVFFNGTNKGTVTDAEGKFVINNITSDEKEVKVSYVGYTEQIIALNGRSELTINLEPTTTEIEDVVVTGIFERRAGSFTGAATAFKAEDIKRAGNKNLLQSLRNLDPSLMFIDNFSAGSDPNNTPDMRLRGASSFDVRSKEDEIDIKGKYANDPNAPLFILDGFETTIQTIMDLNMERVESLTILKDASAKAIYGSKAANGVIVIETKRRTSGEARITYNCVVDFELPDLTSYDLCNAAEKLAVEKDAGMFESYEDASYGYDFLLKNAYNRKLEAVLSGINTDWLSKPLRMGVGNRHSVEVELGSKELQVAANLSYNNTKGVMKGSDRTSYQGGLWLTYRQKNVSLRNQLTINSNVSNDSPYGSFYEYAQLNPYYTPYDESGNLVKNVFAQLFVTSKELSMGDPNFIPNPLYNAQLNSLLKQTYLEITDNFYLEWSIINGLRLTTRVGITENRNDADEYYPGNHLKFRVLSGEDMQRRGSYQKNEGRSKRLSGDVNVNYSKVFAQRHALFFNAGFNLSEYTYQEDIYKAEGLPNEKMNNIMFAKQFALDSKPQGRESTTRDLGVLAAVNYSYDNRYLFDGSYRASASSQFGSESRWGQFWSVGLGWNMHNERWFKRVDFIDMLKLRGSVGYTGSQSSEAYSAIARYGYILDNVYDGFLGATLKNMHNPFLKWQSKFDSNLGVDLNLMKIFQFRFDYYLGKTKNTLTDFTLPYSTGFSSVKENVGEVENRGYDARLTCNLFNNPQERSYVSLTLACSGNTNMIKEISSAMRFYNENQNKIAASGNRPVQKYASGASMDAIWAVPSIGIDPATGVEYFIDTRTGKYTNKWSPAYMVECGNTMPKVNGTIGANASYKGLEVGLNFRVQWGGQYYNQTLVDKVENADLTMNVDRRVFEGRWRKAGDEKRFKALNVNAPHISYLNFNKITTAGTQPTSRFVQDRNELSLSSLNVTYDFWRHKFIKKVGLERLRVSFYMSDVFTLSTIDVERGTHYPFARNFSLSINATF